MYMPWYFADLLVLAMSCNAMNEGPKKPTSAEYERLPSIVSSMCVCVSESFQFGERHSRNRRYQQLDISYTTLEFR